MAAVTGPANGPRNGPRNGPAPGSASASGRGRDLAEGRPAGRLTHLDDTGAARMVDVSAKPETVREAVAAARLVVDPETAALLAAGGLPKGDALAVARVAGIMGAKRTADLIPLCHPLPLSAVEVDLEVLPAAVEIRATARTTARTGVEMEALTSVTVAALALYDMVKGVQRDAHIEGVRLLSKRGGRSGEYVAQGQDPAGRDEPEARPGRGN
jgi:cyclic pyranopterin phosphate synthase